MLFGEILRVAFQSIHANFFRAMLTMLGIIIGVGAVIAMLAAGAGAQKRIDEQIAALGANILTINSARFLTQGVARDQQTLTVDDADALEKDSRYLDAVVPEVQGRGQLKYLNRNTNSRTIGTTHRYADVFNYDVQYGRFFRLDENLAKQRVVVLGSDIPKELEVEPKELLGKTIALNNQPFQVIGILASQGGGGFNRGPDSSAFIPLRTAEKRVFGREQVDNISVRVMDGVPLERAMVDIERVLRKEHRLQPGAPNDFAIVDRRDFLETQQEAQQTFTLLLASIAGVSLIVGGIGIMNIMLVSVTERTREIGVRMAVGARPRDVMAQFLVEALVVCGLGALLGVALGLVVTCGVGTMGTPVVFSMPPVVGAVASALLIGLLFGMMPARKAAQLDPVRALGAE